MGKNKLKKFDDLQGYPHVFQYPFSALQEKGFEMQGKWGKQFFKNENPIVLELGCGKGEIWITFPDPQMKKVRKRLTSTRFMQLYQNILSPEGLIHLKSDSPFMYTYTCEMVKANGYPVQVSTDDLYHSGITDDILEIKTFYEQQWLERGMNNKYIRFVCQPREQFIEPDVDIPYDTYRSFNRGKRNGKQSSQENTTSK